MKNSHTILAISGLLSAIAIVIPMFVPVITLGPAGSYTLFSHVPIMIAMFISPAAAVYVAIGASIGFLLKAVNIVIVMRAFSHIVFAFLGALYLSKHKNLLASKKKTVIFGLVISVVHVVVEFAVSYVMLGMLPSLLGILAISVLCLGFVHSMIDYTAAQFIYRIVQKK